MQTIRVVCAHDCPDMCSMLAQVENGRVVRIQGDPANPLTAGFACAKVNRDHELVHSPRAPGHAAAPRRPQGRRQVRADHAGTRRSTRSSPAGRRSWRKSGPLALLGYAYSAHQGQMNRGLVNGLFHALGASRLQAGTVCDTCCETAWDLTVGPVGGADPESVAQSDLIVSWGADLMATNVHMWAKVEEARKKGVQVDRHRSAPQPHGPARRLAHPHPHRHGCRACARRDAHPGARRSVRRAPISPPTPIGFDRVEGRDPAALRAGARGRDHRAQPWPTSSASRPCTGGPRRPSSASARA